MYPFFGGVHWADEVGFWFGSTRVACQKLSFPSRSGHVYCFCGPRDPSHVIPELKKVRLHLALSAP